MFVRRRPLLRAAVVGGGAYAMGKRRGQRAADDAAAEQGYGNSTYNQPPAGTQGAAADGPSVTDQLAQLSQLHDQGSLSDAEFASAKARLLGS